MEAATIAASFVCITSTSLRIKLITFFENELIITLQLQIVFMKKWRLIVAFCALTFFESIQYTNAQCSICTKTAMQLGEKPAEGLNSGIVYLMLAPFAIVGLIGYRWWRSENVSEGTNS